MDVSLMRVPAPPPPPRQKTKLVQKRARALPPYAFRMWLRMRRLREPGSSRRHAGDASLSRGAE